MYYRVNKYLIDTVVRYLRRVFRYNNQWTNTGLEIVNLADGKEELVFEKFFEENEKYPILTVSPQGGAFTKLAFNDQVLTTGESSYNLGNRSHTAVRVSDTEILKVKIPDDALNSTIKGVCAYAAWTGERVGGDNISVSLYKNYLTSPELIASGSLPGFLEQTYSDVYTDIYPSTALTEEDYWLVFQTSSGSVYSFGIDEDKTSSVYVYGTGSVQASGSIDGQLYLPAFMRIGTMYDGAIMIRCQSKNDSGKAYTLSELTSIYIQLAKHAKLSRETTAQDGLLLNHLNSDVVSELTSKGIYIKDVRIGALEERRRGENDVIFTVSVTVDFNTEWYEEFTAETIAEILPFITEFS